MKTDNRSTGQRVIGLLVLALALYGVYLALAVDLFAGLFVAVVSGLLSLVIFFPTRSRKFWDRIRGKGASSIGAAILVVAVSGAAGIFIGDGSAEPEEAKADDVDCVFGAAGMVTAVLGTAYAAPTGIGLVLGGGAIIGSYHGATSACEDSVEEAKREAILKALAYGIISIDFLKNQYLLENVVVPKIPLPAIPAPEFTAPPLAPNFSNNEQWSPSIPLAPGYNDQQWTPETSTASAEPEPEAVPVSVTIPSQDVAQAAPTYYGSGGYDTKTYVKVMWSLRK